ncbi:MAG TPA: hypothetical protein VM327_04070 [Candidatus Thermoplasmatota archaeon]|nr:hypothetical protein [Candidatus Thermoplasmatota archaeon]
MPATDVLEAKAKECVLCGAVVGGGPEGMEHHAAAVCSWKSVWPGLSLGMDGR